MGKKTVSEKASKCGRKSRQKGASGERELANLAIDCGFTSAKRTAPMQAGGWANEFGDVEIPGLYVEAKRHKRVSVSGWARELFAVARPGLTSVLFYREDGSEWAAVLNGREFLTRHMEIASLRAEVRELRKALDKAPIVQGEAEICVGCKRGFEGECCRSSGA